MTADATPRVTVEALVYQMEARGFDRSEVVAAIEALPNRKYASTFELTLPEVWVATARLRRVKAAREGGGR